MPLPPSGPVMEPTSVRYHGFLCLTMGLTATAQLRSREFVFAMKTAGGNPLTFTQNIQRTYMTNPQVFEAERRRWQIFPSAAAAIKGRMWIRRPVSRVLCRPGRDPNAAVIPLGRASLRGSRDLPGRLGPATALPRREAEARRPYLVLLQAGLAMPSPLPGPRCALTAPFHPCLCFAWGKAKAVCFLWRYPWGRPRRALPAALSPWSPDFPRPTSPSAEQGRDRPAV